MAQIFEIRTLWIVFKDTFTYLTGINEKNRDDIIEAHKATNSAFILTYDYLKNQNGLNRPNLQLAQAWNEAASVVMKVDKSLGEMLYNKSRFWLHPDKYFELGIEDNIIELNDIVEEMEKFRMKI